MTLNECQRNAVSRLPIVSIPILFEIADQRRTEMAIGLLAGIHGHVAAKHVQRLLRDAEGAPVAYCAYSAGAAQRGNRALDRIVHRARGDGFVTDESSLRTVARDSLLQLNRPPGQAVASESRQPEIGSSRYDALFAGRQQQIGVVFRDH